MENFDSFYITSLVISITLIGTLILLYRIRKYFQVNSTIRILVWNLLLCISLLFCVFTIGETYFRFFVDRTSSFSINKISQRWMQRHYQLNNFNVRDNINYSYRIENGKRRISFFGDSFTAGHGINEINNRFGNILRNEYPNSEIHVVASNGANTMHELGTLLELFERGYEFDYVVLVYCLNDIDYLLDETEEIYRSIRSFENNLSFLEKESYFINTLSFRWHAFNNSNLVNYSEFVKKAYNGNEWEQQKENLKKIKYFVDKINARFRVITFPFLQKKSNEYAFKEVHKKINRFWEQENVKHLDLLSVYKPYLGEELVVNEYDAHPNKFANELAAKAINRFLNKE